MSAPIAPAPTVTKRSADEDDLMHITCCDDNRSLCGSDVTDTPWSEEEFDCAVCLDLQNSPCSEGCDW